MACHPGRGELRGRRKQTCPEKELAGGGERELEALEQPEREQGIDDQAAGEGVNREQRRQLDHDAARRPQGCGRSGVVLSGWIRQCAIHEEDRDAGEPVGDEHEAQRVELGYAGRRQDLGESRRQRTQGRTAHADEGVACKEESARLALRRRRQPGVLQRQEHADVAGAGVHRADEGDDQQRPERANAPHAAEAGQHETGRGHQSGSSQQQAALGEAMAPLPDRQGRERGSDRMQTSGGTPPVPHLTTALAGPLRELERRILDSMPAIERWFRLFWQDHTPPFYGSVDLRNAGYKLAPVDMNLFPAGFNNLSDEMLPCAVQAAQSAVERLCPDARNLLLIPERHTRNVHYLSNVVRLARILGTAGLQVRWAAQLHRCGVRLTAAGSVAPALQALAAPGAAGVLPALASWPLGW